MRTKEWLKLGAVLLALQSSVAGAVLVWDNGAPAVANQGGSNLTEFNQAQDFQLTFTSNLTAVRFWSLEGSAADYSGSIFYQIASNNAGVPGAVLASGSVSPTRVAAGSVLGLDQFQNDFAIAVGGLSAGTYWIELHNGSLGNTAFTDFYWSWTDLDATNTPTTRGQEDDLTVAGVFWTTNDQEHAFQIFADRVIDPGPGPGDVPEPGTLALIGTGVAFLGLRRRRPA